MATTPAEAREALLRAIAAAYDALAQDVDARAEERAERALWDATLADGLPYQTVPRNELP